MTWQNGKEGRTEAESTNLSSIREIISKIK